MFPKEETIKFFKRGLSLIEVLVVMAILIILVTTFISGIDYFQKGSVLNNEVEEAVSFLRLARSKTLASENASQYGVFFDISRAPHQWILFKGMSYASREPDFDQAHEITKIAEIGDISLGGASEVVFNRVSGTVDSAGSVSFRLIADSLKTRTVYIENSGRIGFTAPLSDNDEDRFKDSRHVHFDYLRSIETATEKLVLYFGDLKTEEIIINDYLIEGQIYWQGEIEVGGEIQKLKIHTHELNNPYTQFCVHRDGRTNDKPLTLSISGDSSGSLIEYSADGLNTNFTSIYVDNLEWQ